MKIEISEESQDSVCSCFWEIFSSFLPLEFSWTQRTRRWARTRHARTSCNSEYLGRWSKLIIFRVRPAHKAVLEASKLNLLQWLITNKFISAASQAKMEVWSIFWSLRLSLNPKRFSTRKGRRSWPVSYSDLRNVFIFANLVLDPMVSREALDPT